MRDDEKKLPNPVTKRSTDNAWHGAAVRHCDAMRAKGEPWPKYMYEARTVAGLHPHRGRQDVLGQPVREPGSGGRRVNRAEFNALDWVVWQRLYPSVGSAQPPSAPPGPSSLTVPVAWSEIRTDDGRSTDERRTLEREAPQFGGGEDDAIGGADAPGVSEDDDDVDREVERELGEEKHIPLLSTRRAVRQAALAAGIGIYRGLRAFERLRSGGGRR